MREILDYLPIGMLVFQAEKPYKVLYVNSAFANIIGYSETEVLNAGSNNGNRIYPDDLPLIRSVMEQVKETGEYYEFEARIQNRDGACNWFLFRMKYTIDPKDGPTYVITTGDVKQRVAEGQDDVFLSAAFAMISGSKDINASLDMLLKKVGERYNLDVVAVLEDDKEEQEFIQTNCWKKSSGIVEEPVYRSSYNNFKMYLTGFDDRGMRCIGDFDIVEEEQQITLHSGRKIGALINCRFLCRDGKSGIVTFCNLDRTRKWRQYEKDTFYELGKIISVYVSLRSQQIENRDRIIALERRDFLTGLLNTSAFREVAQKKIQHIKPNRQYAIVYGDIRNFSYINENFGIEAGDKILKEFAEAISCKTEILSCRVHSDLLLSLVWDEKKENIIKIVERTLADFSKRQQERYPQSNLRVAAGIYFIEHENEDIDVAIENANLTRKRIKQDTNATVCMVYTNALREQREKEERISSEFENALAKNHLVAFIQPKFQLKTMEMSGGEALVRWIKEDGSMVFPNDFIPVLERTGGIIELDFHVLEQVLRYQKKWKEEGKKLCRISVNFSRKHFEGEGIYERICQLTKDYEIPHEYIEVEIVESLLVAGLDKVKTEMKLLRDAGFVVSIDDFGTGYSSLSMLREMPADIVKIDRSFLNKEDIEAEKEFIEKMGELIRSAKEEIIFEGIETPKQVEFLIGCGFQYGQGFVYDRPMPIDMFEEKYME